MYCDAQNILTVLSCVLFLYFPNVNSISLKVLKKSEAHNHSSHKVKDQHKHEAGICKSPHYGLNPDTTKSLATLEEKLVEFVLKIIDKDYSKEKSNLCHKYLTKYIKEYDEDTLAVEKDKEILGLPHANRSDIVVENPIFALKMVRRIANNLIRDALNECKIPILTVNELFQKQKLIPPTSEDVTKLYGGIMSITFVYKINTTNEPRHGPFNATTAQLKFEDFMALAEWCLTLPLSYDNDGVLSYHWLTAASNALLIEGEPTDSQNTKELEEGWNRLRIKKGLNTIDDMHAVLKKKWQNKWENSDRAHESLCRGESDNIALNNKFGNLVCFVQFFYMTTYKIEVVSLNPAIIYYHKILREDEIHFIRHESPVKLVEPVMFTRRDKFKTEKEYKTAVANELFKVIEEKNHELIVQNIASKVEETTRLQVSEKYTSKYEYALYSPLSHENEVEQMRGISTLYDAQRMNKPLGTYLMFLTDVRMGGYVIFPDLNLYVKPEKGSALFFYNDDDSLVPDERIYHENCPVVFGIKEVANLPLYMPKNEVVENPLPWRIWY